LATDEPDEHAMGELDNAKRSRGACLGQLVFVLALVVIAFVSARYYTFSCYEEYAAVTVLDRFGVEFPARSSQREHVLGRCGLTGDHMMSMVTDTLARASQAVMDTLHGNASAANLENVSDEVKCAPKHPDIMRVCSELPFGCPSPGISYNIMGVIQFGIPCVGATCGIAKTLKEMDFNFLVFLACWLVVFLVCKLIFELRIRALQSSLFNQ